MIFDFRATADQVKSAASAAAYWWAERLSDAAGLSNNGDTDPMRRVMTGGLMAMIRATAPPTEDNRERFHVALKSSIIDHITKAELTYWDAKGFDVGGPCLRIGVDYHPDQILHAALIEAGVNPNVASSAALPIKTMMFCSARRVSVSHGYGAGHVTIYQAWGARIEDQLAADRYRHDQLETYYAWRDELPNDERYALDFPEWVGAVPDLTKETP